MKSFLKNIPKDATIHIQYAGQKIFSESINALEFYKDIAENSLVLIKKLEDRIAFLEGAFGVK